MRKKLLWTFLIIPLILSPLALNIIGVTIAQETHDIAVVSVTPSQTSVKTDDSVNITVAVENQGDFNETFNVTTYYDTTAIKTETNITLAAGANTSLTFTWDTTNVREEVYATEYKSKTYTLKATASVVSNETDTEDNTSVSPFNVEIISQYITVLPQNTLDPTLTPNKNYTVSIYTDYNGSDIWGYEFTLTYNPNVLNGISVINGDLITKEKNESARFVSGTFNNTLGELSLTGAKFDFIELPAPLTSGPGILANVTFRVVGIGDSELILGETYPEVTKLWGFTQDGFGEPYRIIDDITPDLYHLVNGYFLNTIEKPVHDIVIVSITPSNTSVQVGEPVNISVVVKNNGTVTETEVQVKVYYDLLAANWLIGKQTVYTLAAGASKSLAFTWDTTGVRRGAHSVMAVAVPVQGEENTDDNTLVSPIEVTVELPTGPTLPIELIISVVVVAIVVIAVVAYAAKRRKKTTPK